MINSIREILSKNSGVTHIEILMGEKINDNIFDKSVNTYDELLNNLIQHHNYSSYEETLYKNDRDEYIVRNFLDKEEKKIIYNSVEIIDDYLGDKYFICLMNKKNISPLLFSCNKNYDNISKVKTISIKINSLTIYFIEEKENKYLKFVIENNSYIEDALENLKKLNL